MCIAIPRGDSIFILTNHPASFSGRVADPLPPSLNAAHTSVNTVYAQFGSTSPFIKIVCPISNMNISNDVSIPIFRGLIPYKNNADNTGSAIRITQANNRFNPCGDHVLSKSVVMYPTNLLGVIWAGLIMSHFIAARYSSQIPKKIRIPNRKNRLGS
jgi:hypothetical protein